MNQVTCSADWKARIFQQLGLTETVSFKFLLQDFIFTAAKKQYRFRDIPVILPNRWELAPPIRYRRHQGDRYYHESCPTPAAVPKIVPSPDILSHLPQYTAEVTAVLLRQMRLYSGTANILGITLYCVHILKIWLYCNGNHAIAITSIDQIHKCKALIRANSCRMAKVLHRYTNSLIINFIYIQICIYLCWKSIEVYVCIYTTMSVCWSRPLMVKTAMGRSSNRTSASPQFCLQPCVLDVWKTMIESGQFVERHHPSVVVVVLVQMLAASVGGQCRVGALQHRRCFVAHYLCIRNWVRHR